MKWILSFLIFLAPLYSVSRIESIHSITEMELYLDEENHTLALFDIDDALTILGDPAFHRPNFKIHHSAVFTTIMEPLSAKEKLLAFTLPLLTTSGELIEKETPNFLKNFDRRRRLKQ